MTTSETYKAVVAKLEGRIEALCCCGECGGIGTYDDTNIDSYGIKCEWCDDGVLKTDSPLCEDAPIASALLHQVEWLWKFRSTCVHRLPPSAWLMMDIEAQLNAIAKDLGVLDGG